MFIVIIMVQSFFWGDVSGCNVYSGIVNNVSVNDTSHDASYNVILVYDDTSGGTFTPNISYINGNIHYYIVGGGGAGGVSNTGGFFTSGGGGGGGADVSWNSIINNQNLQNQIIHIVVGKGGVTTLNNGVDGSASSIYTLNNYINIDVSGGQGGYSGSGNGGYSGSLNNGGTYSQWSSGNSTGGGGGGYKTDGQSSTSESGIAYGGAGMDFYFSSPTYTIDISGNNAAGGNAAGNTTLSPNLNYGSGGYATYNDTQNGSNGVVILYFNVKTGYSIKGIDLVDIFQLQNNPPTATIRFTSI